jgi:hypothetical protein
LFEASLKRLPRIFEVASERFTLVALGALLVVFAVVEPPAKAREVLKINKEKIETDFLIINLSNFIHKLNLEL